MVVYEKFRNMANEVLLDVYIGLTEDQSYKEIVENLEKTLDELNRKESEDIFTLCVKKGRLESLAMFEKGFELDCRILSNK